MIDGGIFGNFPGGLVAKGSDKQNTTDISVPPGGFAPIDVSMAQDGDIRKVVMALPYKEPGPGIAALYQQVVESGSRLAGIPDMAVGEGRQDAPVGTTIALIEQAIKVTDAVHKRLHNAQSKEFELLRDLFREYPEDFWRFNQDRDSNWDKEKLTQALNNYNLVPRADPNTSSNVQRILRAQALYQMTKANPELFQVSVVLEYILRTLGITNPDGFTQPPQNQAPPPDPKAQAAMTSANAADKKATASLIDANTKAKSAAADVQQKAQQSNNDLKIQQMESADVRFKAHADVQKDAVSSRNDTAIAAAKIGAENQRHATGLVSDHVLARNQQDHEQSLAEQQPAPARARGGRVSRKHPIMKKARRAPDGKLYAPDPDRPGKYLMVS